MEFSYNKVTFLVILCVISNINGSWRPKSMSDVFGKFNKDIDETNKLPEGSLKKGVGEMKAVGNLSFEANMSFLEFFSQLQAINKAVKELTTRTDLSVKNIDSKMIQLSKTASTIPSTNSQDVVKNSFSTIDGMFDVSIELLPIIKEFSDLLSVMSTKLVTAASIIDVSPDKKLVADATKVSSSLETVSKKVNTMRVALDQWITKVRALSATLGKQAVIPADKVNAVTDEIKKTFGAALGDLQKYSSGI